MGNATIRLRRDTAANWTSGNPVLTLGEPGLETDTGKIKFGDGTTAWSGLSYFTAGGGTGTVTSVAVSGGSTGLSVTGSPITTSGTITLGGTLAVANGGTGATTAANARTNLGATTVGSAVFTAADAAAARTAIGAGTGNGTVTSVGGTGTVSGLTLTGTVTGSGSLTLGGTLSATASNISDFNSASRAQTEAMLVAGTNITLTPSGSGATRQITIAASGGGGSGTVTSVSGTGTVSGLSLSGTVTTSGNITLGGTLSVTPSNFASQTANTFLAAPNGSAGVPTFRAIVAADIPTLNQNTTGSAATLTTGRTIGMTGDVVWTSASFNGSGNVTGTSTIQNDAVSNAKLANMATATIKGRTTAGTGDPEDLTAAQATALLDTFTSSLKGLAPASGGGTTNFLRADGTWAAPPGGGGGVTSVDVSGGTTGLTFTGGPITSSGTITASGTLDLDNGGTGATTASGARTNLGAAASGAVGSSGLTMTTARLLGRTTASTGAIEEITVGSGLSLSGGTLTATGGGSDPWTYIKLSADLTNDTTSNVNSNLRFLPPNNSTVIWEAMLLVRSAATTTGPRVGVAQPTGGVTDSVWEVRAATGATAASFRFAGNTSTRQDATAWPTAGTSWPVHAWGTIITGTVTGDLIITLASEIAASQVRIQAHSWLRWRTI